MKTSTPLTFRRYLDTVLEPTLLAALVVLVVVVLWQVFSRYVLKAPSTMTSEIARFLLMWLTLLGAAWVVGQRSHLAIDLLADKLSSKNRHKLSIVLILLMATFSFFVLLVGGISLVQMTLKLMQMSTVLQVPMGYVYLALPISGAFMVCYCICALFENNSQSGLDNNQPLSQNKES